MELKQLVSQYSRAITLAAGLGLGMMSNGWNGKICCAYILRGE